MSASSILSFLFQGIPVPLIVLLFLIATSMPVFIKWYKRFHEKFVRTGKLQKNLDKVVEVTETQFKTVRKTTQKLAKDASKKIESHRKSHSEQKPEQESHAMEKKLLQVLAGKGDSGMLDRSIADTLQLDTSKTKKLLDYLESKNFIESVNGVSGVKYYLSNIGKSYCQKKGYQT